MKFVWCTNAYYIYIWIFNNLIVIINGDKKDNGNDFNLIDLNNHMSVNFTAPALLTQALVLMVLSYYFKFN